MINRARRMPVVIARYTRTDSRRHQDDRAANGACAREIYTHSRDSVDMKRFSLVGHKMLRFQERQSELDIRDINEAHNDWSLMTAGPDRRTLIARLQVSCRNSMQCNARRYSSSQRDMQNQPLEGAHFWERFALSISISAVVV